MSRDLPTLQCCRLSAKSDLIIISFVEPPYPPKMKGKFLKKLWHRSSGKVKHEKLRIICRIINLVPLLKTRTKRSTLCLYYLSNYILSNVFKLNKVRDQYSLPQSDLALVPADTAMLLKALPWVSHLPPTEQRARLS